MQTALSGDVVAEGVIRETRDHQSVRRVALEAGLEDGDFEGIISVYGYYIGDELAGCVALKGSGMACSVEWLAVRRQHRGKGIGRMLVDRIASDARRSGAKQLWALARTPDFFIHIGFVEGSLEASPGPSLDNCRRCDQFRTTCSPKIVVKAL